MQAQEDFILMESGERRVRQHVPKFTYTAHRSDHPKEGDFHGQEGQDLFLIKAC